MGVSDTPPPVLDRMIVNPPHLVRVLRLLVNASRQPTGPTLDHAREITAGLELHPGWLEALLTGWENGQEEYRRRGWAKRSALYRYPDLVKPTPIRFLEPKLLPVIDLREDPSLPSHKKRCQLCGLTPPGRSTSWCPACWEALKPQTSIGWGELCMAVYERDRGVCQCGCEINVDDVKARARRADWKEQRAIEQQHGIRPDRQAYDVDHVVALVDGGAHELANLRLLSPACHRRVTAEAARQRAQVRRAERTGLDPAPASRNELQSPTGGEQLTIFKVERRELE